MLVSAHIYASYVNKHGDREETEIRHRAMLTHARRLFVGQYDMDVIIKRRQDSPQ
jgi:hypothetical protein